MTDVFDVQLEKVPSEDALRKALASAFDFSDDEIDIQYLDRYDSTAPERKLFCLITEGEVGDGGFPTLLTLSLQEERQLESEVAIASKISESLGMACLISSGSLYDDDTRLLIRGQEPPKLVLVCEDYDEFNAQYSHYLKELD